MNNPDTSISVRAGQWVWDVNNPALAGFKVASVRVKGVLLHEIAGGLYIPDIFAMSQDRYIALYRLKIEERS